MAANQHIKNQKRFEKAAVLLALDKTSKVGAGGCPADEELAAMVDGRLQGDAAEKLRDHFSSCGQCYDQWVLLWRMKNERGSKGRVIRLKWMKRLSYAGSALAAAASVAIFLNISRIDREAVDFSASPRVEVKQEQVSTALLPPQQIVVEPASSEADHDTTMKGPVSSDDPGPVRKMKSAEQATAEEETPTLPERSLSAPVPHKNFVPAPRPVASAGSATIRREVGAQGGLIKSATEKDEALSLWYQQVAESCRVGRQDLAFWLEIRKKGVRLLAERSESLTAPEIQHTRYIIHLLEAMGGGDSIARQCQSILSEIAQDK